MSEMKEHPILFNGPMVRAILDKTKTQTRRVIKPQPPSKTNRAQYNPSSIDLDRGWYFAPHGGRAKCPYGVPGDRLWVRETWGCREADHPLCKDGRKPQDGDRIVYRANPADDYQWGSGKGSQGSFCWRPSIHMPRWASRITLEVMGVRVERVQDISEEDAKAEGVYSIDIPIIDEETGNHLGDQPSFRYGFQELWDSTVAKRGYGWDVNPWVWVVEFKELVK